MTIPDAHQLLRELAASRELTRQLAERVAICSELLSRAAVRLDWPREGMAIIIERIDAMATAPQVMALIESHYAGDHERFRSVSLQIAAHENGLGRYMGDRIIKRVGNQPASALQPLPHGRDREGWLFDHLEPRFSLADLVLDDDTRGRLGRIIHEVSEAPRLADHGLLPCLRIMFDGPPGVGKTASAEAIAKELGLPFLVARHDTIISSYLGETATNLRKAFDWAKSNRAVILFDEFDSFGRARTGDKDVGEVNRILNVILQLLDRHAGPSLIITATNLPDVIDPAMERRFDAAIRFPMPSEADREQLIRRHLGDVNGFAFSGSHAQVVRECVMEKKRRVLATV